MSNPETDMFDPGDLTPDYRETQRKVAEIWERGLRILEQLRRSKLALIDTMEIELRKRRETKTLTIFCPIEHDGLDAFGSEKENVPKQAA